MFCKTVIRVVFFVLTGMLVCAPLQTRAQSKEYQLKAAFLFNFAQFVEWPPETFATPDAPFCIGVLGDDPFGSALDAMVQGETISGHKITVLRASQLDVLKNCQIVFVSKSEKNRIPEILAALKSKPVLTVGDMENFGQRGGNINFYQEDNKVRFAINPAAAKEDGLRISSQLLRLGKIVHPDKEADK